MGELKLALGRPPSQEKDKDKVKSIEFDLVRTAPQSRDKKGKPKDK